MTKDYFEQTSASASANVKVKNRIRGCEKSDIRPIPNQK